MKFPTLFIIFLLLSSKSFARKPAVEPIMGISIEEYKQVSPEKAKGYDFQERQVTPTKNIKRKHSVENLSVQSATEPQEKISLIVLFFIALPIVASVITYFNFKNNTQIANNSNHSQNENQTTDIDDDYDFPQAS